MLGLVVVVVVVVVVPVLVLALVLVLVLPPRGRDGAGAALLCMIVKLLNDISISTITCIVDHHYDYSYV